MDKKTERFLLRIAKILGIILITLFLIVCIAQVWLLVWGGDKLKAEMQARIHQGSDGLYRFDTESTGLGIFGLSITFENATLKPDTVVFNEMKSRDEADKRLYDLQFKRLKISGINIIKFLRKDELRISGLHINSPQIKIFNHADITPEKNDEKAKFTLYALFSKQLDVIEINSFEMKDGFISMLEIDDDTSSTLELFNFNIEMSEIMVDSSHDKTAEKLFATESMNFSSDSIFTTLDNGMYHLTANNISSSSDKKEIKIHNLVLDPQLTKFDFAHHYGYENDRINLLIDSVLIEHTSTVEMLQTGKFKMGKIVLKNFNFHAFRDKRLKLAEVYKKLPQEMLRELPIPLEIDTLELINARISYEEFPDTGDEAGIIFFNNANAKVTNITNQQENAKSDKLRIIASGYVYGKARLDADFTLHLFNTDNVFSFAGTLGEIDPVTFNEMSIPVGGVEIESGLVSKMEFSANANTTHSEGNMQLYYEDLKIKVRDMETGRSKGFQSFIANLFVVKNSNPKDGEFRQGEMRFERDTRKAITNYCWKTILSGMKSSIGLGPDLPNEDE